MRQLNSNKAPMKRLVKRDKVQDMIVNKSRGTFFTVVFTKKNGEIRKMNARTGVKKGLVGGKNTTAHITKYLTVYDVQARGYRTLNLDTLQSIRIGGTSYEVI